MGIPSRTIVRSVAPSLLRLSGSGGASRSATARTSTESEAIQASVEASPQPTTPRAGNPSPGSPKNASARSPWIRSASKIAFTAFAKTTAITIGRVAWFAWR